MADETIDIKDMTRKLHQFVVNNDELELLEAKMGAFNPFNILKIEKHEIRHSNMLGWLLDPNANHNLHDKLLKKIISEVVSTSENIDSRLSVGNIQLNSFSDAEVKREWKNIDLLIASQSNNLVIFFENKIYSQEANNQLKRYLTIVREHYSTYCILPTYLTLMGDEPSEREDYCVLSYERICQIIKFSIDLYKDNLNPKVFDLIMYYSKILEVLTMQNADISRLCKDIYSKHKEAVDLIVEYGLTSEFESAANDFKIQNEDIIETFRNNRRYWFVPKEFKKYDLRIADEWRSPYCISFWFMKRQNDKLGLILEVGPVKNPEERIKLLKRIKEDNYFRVPVRALDPERKYTRIFTKYIDFDEWDNKDRIVEEMNDLYKNKAKIARNNILKLLDSWNR